MSWLSNLFKGAKKTNLTPDVSYPKQENLYYTGKLRDLANQRLSGQGLGYGDEYVSKTSNPEIAQIENKFQTDTMPFLQNQLSKRGVARSGGSGLATDILGGAEWQKNLDVSSTVGKYYQLNELQKKADFTQGLNLATGLQDQQKAMLDDEAAASERLSQRTQEDSRYRQGYEDKKMGQSLQAAAMALPAVGGALGTIGGAIGGPVGGMIGSLGQGTTGLAQSYQAMKQSPTLAPILGQIQNTGMKPEEIIAYLRAAGVKI